MGYRIAARATLLLCTGLLCVGMAAPRGAMAYTFQIISVRGVNPSNPCLGGYGINDNGRVVLYDCSSGGGIPYTWRNGRLRALPQHPLAGPVGGGVLGGTFPLSISNAGQIAGYYYDVVGAFHGFTYTPPSARNPTAVWTTQDHPVPATVTAGTPVKTILIGLSLTHGTNLGVVGGYSVPSGRSVGTVEGAGRPVMDVTATDQWQDFDGGSDPVNGLYNSIVSATGASTLATGINDHGVIAGRRGAPFYDAFIYVGGTRLRNAAVCQLFTSANPNVPVPGGCVPRFTTFNYNGYRTFAWGINAAGDVTGWFNDAANNNFGQSFVRNGATGAIRVLNVTDPATGASYISCALGINNLGQVVGDAYPTPASWNGAPGPAGDGPGVFVATP